MLDALFYPARRLFEIYREPELEGKQHVTDPFLEGRQARMDHRESRRISKLFTSHGNLVLENKNALEGRLCSIPDPYGAPKRVRKKLANCLIIDVRDGVS
jgi:hypothetical protein